MGIGSRAQRRRAPDESDRLMKRSKLMQVLRAGIQHKRSEGTIHIHLHVR